MFISKVDIQIDIHIQVDDVVIRSGKRDSWSSESVITSHESQT